MIQAAIFSMCSSLLEFIELGSNLTGSALVFILFVGSALVFILFVGMVLLVLGLMPGVRCPACAARGVESWVLPGKNCKICNHPC